ncbi:YL1 nuclear [Penicillium chermesinum]|uniref:YL1 nuclear n=1 Tax=Penicillium chermesinum TaxID=63820 RepID=A0A9W9TA42_9EURO|nr:YL1 nuclear [Penicillium chermesinum]KAJ5214864.1 YL1 nuclear [Penicillium chermesinum]
MADGPEAEPSSGFQSSEDEAEEVAVESLVQGRAKRSTAGTHMSALIEAAADDDLTLLFEEVEDDNDFAAEADGADEEDEALDSSSDEDDQGPNATNDYEGEKELQKAERKKRRAQNDLRFQTLRKRVKIDPTAVSSVSVPPRPKKKSERISWIPTVEDGPTRSSSRRQTMVNKEMTHARLKDSQEKRIRIIATMKEAEKRKAHLKPKAMTQEDHLAEAARIERLNSKSLNRWEQAERRKADERRAKIEALQNRRLEGPVISYWSGLATWANGRLIRVGKAEIKSKPEKDTTKKKKSEKEDKASVPVPTPAPAPAEEGLPQGTPGPTTTPIPGPVPQADSSAVPPGEQSPAVGGSTAAASMPTPNPPTDESIHPVTASPSVSTNHQQEEPEGKQADKRNIEETQKESQGEKASEPLPPVVPEKEETKVAEEGPSEPIVTRNERDASEKPLANIPSGEKDPAGKVDSMEIDATRSESNTAEAAKAKELPPTTGSPPSARVPDNLTETAGETTQTKSTLNATGDLPVQVTPSDTPTAPPVSQAPPTPHNAQTLQAPQTTTPTPAAPAQNNAITAQADGPGALVPSQPPVVNEASMQPEVPAPPPVIEYTGRNLTILENFDDRTAHSKKYSMYFNARKPPRLTSMCPAPIREFAEDSQETNYLLEISSSLCVITSLPSRYRDPETALPYANSYAYGQIRRIMSEGYIWSSMLGCFVGPGETAARGVPARFLGGEKELSEGPESKEPTTTEAAETSEPRKKPAAPTEPMDVDS